MIIKDAKKLRELPVGSEVLLVQKIKIVEVGVLGSDPCVGCFFLDTSCPDCFGRDRPDGKEVRYVKA